MAFEIEEIRSLANFRFLDLWFSPLLQRWIGFSDRRGSEFHNRGIVDLHCPTTGLTIGLDASCALCTSPYSEATDSTSGRIRVEQRLRKQPQP